MSLTASTVDKESSLEVCIGAKNASAVTLTAILFPGVSMLGGARHESGTTTSVRQQKAPRDALQAAWVPLIKAAPIGLPAGESFELLGRVHGKTALEVHTTLAAAHADPSLSATVVALISVAKTVNPELAARAATLWSPVEGVK